MPRVETPPDSQRDAYAPSLGTHQINFSLPSSGKISDVSLRGKFYLNADPGADAVQVSGNVGMQMLIEQLQIVAADGSVLEDLQHYARTVSSLYQTSMSTPELSMTSIGSREMLAGSADGAELLLKGCVRDSELYFSIKLHSGLLAQNPNLSRWGGLSVRVRLAQDANVTAGGDAGNYQYLLRDVKLCSKIVDEVPGEAKNQVIFPTVYTVKNALRSGRSINTVSVPSTKVLSGWQSYMLAAYDGNPAYNTSALMDLPDLTEVKFTWGGASFPSQFPIRSSSASDAEIIKGFLAAASGKMTLANGDSEMVDDADIGEVHGTGVDYTPLGGVDLSSRKFGIEVVSGATANTPWTMWSHFRVLESA